MNKEKLNYTIKGRRLNIYDSQSNDVVGFVALVYESGLNIPEYVEEFDASNYTYSNIDDIIKSYEIAREYASSFHGHTLPETIAGFAVCNADGKCQLFLEDHRVGSLLVDCGKDRNGETKYSLVKNVDRDTVSIKEGDHIKCGHNYFELDGVNIYSQEGNKAELLAALQATYEDAKKQNGHSRR